MQIRWMFRAMESDEPRARGMLICHENEKHPRELAVLVKFVPDDQGAKHRNFWLQELSEPEVGKSLDLEGDVFQVYAKMEVTDPKAEMAPVTKASIKMPVRTT